MELKRAVSTAYYAIFHAIACSNADALIGKVKRLRSEAAWERTYRALNHGQAKSACGDVRNMVIDQGIKDCADAFIQLQQRRHDADYDPAHRLTRQEALDAIVDAEVGIAGLKGAPTIDRRTFAAQLLFRNR